MHRLDSSRCIEHFFFFARIRLNGAGFENYKPASITHIDAGFETGTDDRSHCAASVVPVGKIGIREIPNRRRSAFL